MTTPSPAEVLTYWFGALQSDSEFPEEKAKMWFAGGEEVDRYIRTNFLHALKRAICGDLDEWQKDARSALALVILLDQFSRNIFRDSPQMFAQDKKALEIALDAIDHGYDTAIKPVEAIFFYMPLEHSEDIKIQEKSLALFNAVVERAPAATQFPMQNALDYAKQHYDIIKRFGRYPHRNDILGRQSTAEELEFLKQPGKTWYRCK